MPRPKRSSDSPERLFQSPGFGGADLQIGARARLKSGAGARLGEPSDLKPMRSEPASEHGLPSPRHNTLALSLLACAIACLLGACGSRTPAEPAARAPADSSLAVMDPDRPVLAPFNVVRSVEPWSFMGEPGQIIRTPSYRIYTTEQSPAIVRRLPRFLESCLDHYRTALIDIEEGDAEPLPLPSLKLDTFVMASRPQWERLTKQLMGEQATTYLRIPRGGYASGGRAVLFDVGAGDTLTIAAHEGWHQYTQRAFHQSLPVWLEEGVATYMEGHGWTGQLGDTVVFRPWANVERFDQLRKAVGDNRVMPLPTLLDSTPADLLGAGAAGGGGGDGALTFYAQVWALTHFLHEGENGRYRAGLYQLVRDAAEGRLYARVAQSRGNAAAVNAAASRRGTAVFETYFNADLAEAAAQYQRFVEQVAAPGSRGPIVAGESPINTDR